MTPVDEATGEVTDGPAELTLVPLNIAELDEDELLAKFPSPVQCAGALMTAMERISKAPEALERLAAAVAEAKRAWTVANGMAFVRWRRDGSSIADARALASIDDTVTAAVEDVDTAVLALEYGRELRRTLTTEIDILRSLNANMRGAHS